MYGWLLCGIKFIGLFLSFELYFQRTMPQDNDRERTWKYVPSNIGRNWKQLHREKPWGKKRWSRDGSLTYVGVILVLVTLEGRPVFLGYGEADLPQRERCNDICNDPVHMILQSGLNCSGYSTFLLIGGIWLSQPTTWWSSLWWWVVLANPENALPPAVVCIGVYFMKSVGLLFINHPLA